MIEQRRRLAAGEEPLPQLKIATPLIRNTSYNLDVYTCYKTPK